jgi:predicted methyltransferase
MHLRLTALAAALCLVGCAPMPSTNESTEVPAAMPTEAQTAALSSLDSAIAGSHRSVENRARDAFRNPKATLEFFGFKPNQTVIEITPGGGWFTEILAPALRDQGRLITAVPNPATANSDGAKNYYSRSNTEFRAKLAGDVANFGRVETVEFDLKNPTLGAANSADMVVTFRNVHNWTGSGSDGKMFKAFFDVLKPGGVLGVEEHRAKAGTPVNEETLKTGYLPTDYVIKLATDAGFKLDGQAEINANPRDMADGPVWRLPPNLNVKTDEERAKNREIGESDRMTLRFVKPAA